MSRLPAAPPDASAVSRAAAPTSRDGLLVAAAVAIGLGLTVLPPSTSRILAWPWAGFATAGWLLAIGVALHGLLFNRDQARLGGTLDGGFGTLAIAATASALISPLRDIALPATLPVLGACALPYALLPVLRDTSGEPKRGFRVLGLLAIPVLASSVLAWLHPWAWTGWPGDRNALPFGHGNTTGSFGVLATSWLLACAARARGGGRIGFLAGAALAVFVALSSESRGAGLALTALIAVAAGLHSLRRRRFILFMVSCVAVLGLAVGTNARLRELVTECQWNDAARESNAQRMAMIVGGLKLGGERPLLGWGAGTVPQVFPRVRGSLPGSADNFLHLHNFGAQTWATLGAVGGLALLLLSLGLFGAIRRCTWSAQEIWLVAGLAGGVALSLFDHPWDAPAVAALGAAHVAALAGRRRARSALWPRLAAGAAGLLVLLVLPAVIHDVLARAAYARALDAAQREDSETYATELRHAAAWMPADPYYPHLLAAHLATGHPFPNLRGGAAETAAAVLDRTLASNPDLEYAHYNLGWLLLGRDPAAAARHFLSAARVAPTRGEVYLGLGLARLRNGDTPDVVRAFAAEWLNDPANAWSPRWFLPPLASLRPAIAELAAAALPRGDPRSAELAAAWRAATTPARAGPAFRRLRTGYGVLLGHPDGLPPVDVNVQTTVELPDTIARICPNKGWLGGRFLLEFLGQTTN